MNLRFQLALRNILRNRRRTALNISMIAAGIAAIVVFKGFSHNLVRKLEWVAINTQYGHIQVASEKTWKLSVKDKPKDRLIHLTPELSRQIDSMGEVQYASGRITFFGMINNGEQSLSARGVGFDPGKEVQMLNSMRVIEGRNLNPDSKFEIILGKGISDQIAMQVGSTVTLMAYTYDGSVNALDCDLVGIFQSGLAEIDNSTFFLPLSTAQKLLDTDGLERVVVMLKSNDRMEPVQSALEHVLPAGIQSQTWKQMAVYYRQVVDFSAKQNLIIQWILMLLALLAIGNIVGMSIAERTGEIGTIRAMGDSRGDVIYQFLLEGIILGVLGGIAGCILGYVAAKGLTYSQYPIVTPGASLPLPMEVDILPAAFVEAFLVMTLMAVVATLLPALRASRIEIVEALKRNI